MANWHKKLAPSYRLGQIPKIRMAPYPFQAILAISSDIDGAKFATFVELHRLMNTRVETVWGRGVGLDISDSFWFYNGPKGNQDSCTLLSGEVGTELSAHAEFLAELVRKRHIDTIHTFGNLAGPLFRRDSAEKAVALSQDMGLSFPIWTDHGGSKNHQNLLEPGYGANPAHAAYHADLLSGLNVRYLALPKQREEVVRDSLLEPVTLVDGQTFWGFPRMSMVSGMPERAMRSMLSEQEIALLKPRTGNKAVRAVVWHPPFLHLQLSDERLDALVEQGGYCVVGQHLTYINQRYRATPNFVGSFSRLAERQEKGEILVASTHRLLEFERVRRHLDYDVIPHSGGRREIRIRGLKTPAFDKNPLRVEELRGIQFMVDDPDRYRIEALGKPVPDRTLFRHRSDEGGLIGFGWPRVSYPLFEADELQPASKEVERLRRLSRPIV